MNQNLLDFLSALGMTPVMTAECCGATNARECVAQEGEIDIKAIAFSLQLERFFTCSSLEEAEKEAKEWVKTYGVKAQVFQLSKTYVPENLWN